MKYVVSFCEHHSVTVEANSIKEADEIARKKYEDGFDTFQELSDFEIEEVE